jgi:multiple sugar transport system permease protein
MRMVAHEPQLGVAGYTTWDVRLLHWFESSSRMIFLLPAILVVLFLSVFPLIASLYVAFNRVMLVPGGFQFTFVGLENFRRLLFGSEQRHFIGRFDNPPLLWAILGGVFAAIMVYMLYQYARSPRLSAFGFIMRVITIILASLLFAAVIYTGGERGLPGTLVVTMIYVFVGVFFQYTIGLGLALLVTQNLRGKRFFRVVFLLPMMITPVGVAFLFRMMVDTVKGPFSPVWSFLGLGSISWADTPFGARAAVMIGDTWQWTPFMFIILLAALEGVSREQIEAALVDGAQRFQLFRFIIFPQIAPVTVTVILIRIIEAFKIIDMPNVLTGGGPGTATESMTLYAYIAWRSQDYGLSAASAYVLLFVVTFIALVIVNIIRPRVVERVT